MRVCVPIGLGAGIDVDGIGIGGLTKLGFGSVEVGSVSMRPKQAVNENHVAFTSSCVLASKNRSDACDGFDVVAKRYCDYIEKRNEDLLARNLVSGLSVRIESLEDIDCVVENHMLMSVADYLCFDVCNMDAAEIPIAVEKISHKLKAEENMAPIFLKVGLANSFPPEPKLVAAIQQSDVVVGVNIAGSGIATIAPPEIADQFPKGEELIIGGDVVKSKAHDAVSNWYKALCCQYSGKQIIASGGVASGRDALNLIESGASMVQVFSSFVLDGFQVPRRIKSQLSIQLMNKGYYNLDEAIGAKHRPSSSRLLQAMKRRKRF